MTKKATVFNLLLLIIGLASITVGGVLFFASTVPLALKAVILFLIGIKISNAAVEELGW